MSVRVQIDGEDDRSEREVRALLNWVRAEEIDGVGARLAVGKPGEGEMGALQEALTIFGPGGAGAAVGAALLTWLQSRRPGLTLTLTDADGSSKAISVSATQRADEALTRFLDEAFGPGGNQTIPATADE